MCRFGRFELITLLVDEPHTILDVGCGTGGLCRRLVHSAARVDAMDFSAVMVEKGKALPDGHDPDLHWILGRVEETALEPAYALITAGESLHWMDWSTVLPIFARSLTQNGGLAIVERSTTPTPWDEGLETLNGFSRQRMGAEAAQAFDHEVGNVLSPYLQEGLLTLGVIGHVVWGHPETLF
jgi:trans-aconitate methyltransferase